MKHMRKILSLLLAIVMVMGLATTAFAANQHNHTITINDSNGGHTYRAYQVFKGEFKDDETAGTEETKGFLSNVEWGDGVNGEALLAELQTLDAYRACKSAQDVAEVLRQKDDFSAEANAFAGVVANHLNESGHASEATAPSDGKYVINVVGDGYYFVHDAEPVTGHDSSNRYILRVGGDMEVNPKKSVPTVDKKVEEVDGGNSSFGTVASYDIGDYIKYTLTAKLGASLVSYTEYELTFLDTLSKGLTFVNDAQHPLSITTREGTKIITDKFTVSADKQADNTTKLTITRANILDFTVDESENATHPKFVGGDTITVTYYAQLNEDAVVGLTGNENTVMLEYSNDPYVHDRRGTAPGPSPKVLTYKLVINKKDENKQPLGGAAFKLEKYNGTDYVLVKDYKGLQSADKSQFVFEGLDEGQYRLSESVTPDGYNTYKTVSFIIEEHIDTGDLASSYITGQGFAGDNGRITFSNVDQNGAEDKLSLSADIQNKRGAQLPSTGGIGTTIFYVVGVILVLGAGVLLFTKKRSTKN